MTAPTMPVEVSEYEGERPVATAIFGYYRQENGWITVDVTSPMERMKYMEQGQMLLTNYPTFDLCTEYSVNRPFEALFMYGGAKEMPLEQVIENAFHVKAPTVPHCGKPITDIHKKHMAKLGCLPYQKVTFPQIPPGLEIFPCQDETCNRVGDNSFGTLTARNKHEKVMHKEEKAEIRQGKIMGDSIASALAIALGSRTIQAPAGVTFTEAQKKALADAGINIEVSK